MPKSSKNPSKRRAAPRRVSQKTGIVYKLPRQLPKRNTALVKRVCSISNPFCDAAIGSKWHDDAANKTMPYAARALSTIQSNASGVGATLMLPSFTYGVAIPASVVGSTSDYTLQAAVIPFTFTPSAYRIVSWGFTLKNLTAPLYSSGMVRIRGLSNINGSSLTSVNSALFNDFHYDIPLQDCHEVAIIGRRLNETHHFFRAPSDTTPTQNVADWVAPGWCPILVHVTGVPVSQDILQVEYFINYELTWDDGSSMALMTTPSPPSNPLVSTASSKVTQAVGNVFIKGMQQVENAVVKAATTYVGGLIGGFLGGPPGAIAGRGVGYAITDAMEVD